MNPPNPGLKPIGGTMRLRYDSRRPSKAQINVPPGATIDVPDEVAAQLQRADSHFKQVTDDPPPAEDPDPEPEDDTTCGECGFVAKTAGGLAAHQRSHA